MDSGDLILKELTASRRMLVEQLATPPTAQNLRDLAHTQLAISAVEAVIAERDSATGIMPLRQT